MRLSICCALLLAWPLASQANDNFNTPTTLSPSGGTLTGSTAGATAHLGETGVSGFAYARSHWFRITSTSNFRFNAKTEGSDFDTTLAVYAGSNVSELRLVAGNDDFAPNRWSQVDVNLLAGSYWVAIDGFNNATGNYTLSWQTETSITVSPVSSNDAFASASTLAAAETGSVALINNLTATLEAGEPALGGRSLWFRYTPTRSGNHRVYSLDSSYDPALQVYTGSALNALALVDAVDDIDGPNGNLESAVEFNAVAGTTYHIRLTAIGGTAGIGKLVAAPATVTGLPALDATYGGTWWNPLRDGEGVLLEIADHPVPTSNEQFVFFSWYTYDPDGNPVYLVGGTPRNPTEALSNDIVIPVVRTRGARFGANFNSAQVVREAWGTVTLRYRNCGQMQLAYAPTLAGWGAPGTINLERILARGPGATCP